MAETINRVVLIVDRDYGSRLASLVTEPVAVWIIDTPANRMAAETCWQRQGGAVVTTFKSSADSPATACLGILNMIDLHHGKYSGDYSVLEVIGSPSTEELYSAIKEPGFSKFEPTPAGFRATRGYT